LEIEHLAQAHDRVGTPAESLLHLDGRGCRDLGAEPAAGHIDEAPRVRTAHVDHSWGPGAGDLEATVQVVDRQVAAVREIVGRAERQNSHGGPRRLLSLADERVDHGVDRPVPATGDDPRGAGVERLLHDSALIPLVPGDAHAKIDSSSADVPNGLLDLRPVGRLPV
jgi:hypothetical protein